MIKPFPNLIYKKKDRNLPSSKSKLKEEENVKSKPLIIFGFIIHLETQVNTMKTMIEEYLGQRNGKKIKDTYNKS